MNSTVSHIDLTTATRLKAFYELLKPRLSFLVVFSSGFGYALASQSSINWGSFVLFLLAGFLVSGSSVTINQVIEQKYDAIMNRTRNRPIPSNRITDTEAVWFSIITGVAGLGMMLIATNILATALSLLSLLLYAFVYTPLKRVGSIAVFVGAIPGALPPMIGWAAASGVLSYEAMIIFGIQFIWQFPHFWAIAWVSDEDYKKAGFKLLPGGGSKDLNTAINIMVYTLFLLPLGLLPTMFGLTGLTSGVVATICGVLFLATTFSLMKDTSNQKARRIMFGSFIYLPIVQITFLLDKL
ncbi:protoheme IX farnesyltransferase [Ekhidna lutea]|uniref:Protoheme IX farnesyltransferase n=1 Tax=Ekhidna lutea TaxID=447679 RepID=A0A239HBJ0_EKHLU|nr:heme o synthase [Ekhidna lutea]SNS78747.1 protoheme IX farnesyltransferase [Ekhidna lutea]